MHIRPILSSLRKHKIAALLIVLEIAFSCAVVCNALFLINLRLERMQRPTGAVEQQIVQLRIRSVDRKDDSAALTREDLDALRRIPGVRNASVVNQTLFGSTVGASGISLSADQQRSTLRATNYFGDAQLLDTLGLTLVAGRRFNADEFLDYARLQDPNDTGTVPAVILSQALAQRLFPDGTALGRTIHVFGEHRIVGIVQRLVQPRDFGSAADYEDAMLFPVNMPYTSGTYLLRVADPAQREAVLLAYTANLWLMNAYELPRLPLWYLPVGALALWLLGQLAVLGPARRATRVPPAVATRSA